MSTPSIPRDAMTPPMTADEGAELLRRVTARPTNGVTWAPREQAERAVLAELDRGGERITAALALADQLDNRAADVAPREYRGELDQGNVDDIHDHGVSTGLADAFRQAAGELRAIVLEMPSARRALTEETDRG